MQIVKIKKTGERRAAGTKKITTKKIGIIMIRPRETGTRRIIPTGIKRTPLTGQKKTPPTGQKKTLPTGARKTTQIGIKKTGTRRTKTSTTGRKMIPLQSEMQKRKDWPLLEDG